MSKRLRYNQLIDGIFLPGQSMKRIYEKSDISKNKLFVTGTPKIDILYHAKGKEFVSREEFLKGYDADLERQNIFIFSSFVPLNEEYALKEPAFEGNRKQIRKYNDAVTKSAKAFTKMISQLSQDFPEINIFVKPHPLEKKILTESLGENMYLVKGKSLYNCIRSIDLAIHWNSTVAVECWIRHIPTIQYIPLKDSLSSIAISRVGNPVGFTYSEIAKLTRNNLSKQPSPKWTSVQMKYLDANFYKIDGQACNRISLIVGRSLKINSQTEFKPTFPLYYLFFEVLYIFLGKTLSRRLISLVRPFQWKYAVNNDVFFS